MDKLTKTEQKLLDCVRRINDGGGLAGLGGACHTDADYGEPKYRFVKRLADKGLIHYCAWTPQLGAGWILAGRDSANPKQDSLSGAPRA